MKPAVMWPVAIVGVLGVTVAANLVLLYAAGDRNGAVVERDYYRKGLAWDSTLAQRARSAALGWRADAAIGPVREGAARVTVTLSGADSAAVRGAALAVSAIHNTRADRPVAGALMEEAPGRYAGTLALDRPGLWELRLEAVHGVDRFETSVTAETGTSR